MATRFRVNVDGGLAGQSGGREDNVYIEDVLLYTLTQLGEGCTVGGSLYRVNLVKCMVDRRREFCF